MIITFCESKSRLMVNHVWTRIVLNSKSRLVVNRVWSINFQAFIAIKHILWLFHHIIFGLAIVSDRSFIKLDESSFHSFFYASSFELVAMNGNDHGRFCFLRFELRVSRHEWKRSWKILRWLHQIKIFVTSVMKFQSALPCYDENVKTSHVFVLQMMEWMVVINMVPVTLFLIELGMGQFLDKTIWVF